MLSLNSILRYRALIEPFREAFNGQEISKKPRRADAKSDGESDGEIKGNLEQKKIYIASAD